MAPLAAGFGGAAALAGGGGAALAGAGGAALAGDQEERRFVARWRNGRHGADKAGPAPTCFFWSSDKGTRVISYGCVVLK